MGTTKKSHWELAVNALKEKGVAQEIINSALNGKEKNKDKFEALNPLLEQYKIDINVGDKTPTLQAFFGREIANLLIKQKSLFSQIGDSSILVTNIKSQNIEDVLKDTEDKEALLKYLKNESKIEELNKINKELEKKGLIYKPIKKKKSEKNE